MCKHRACGNDPVVTHQRTAVIECNAGQGAETGPTFALKFSTGGGGTTTWVLKVPKMDMATAWKTAVMHNKAVMPTDSAWRTGG